MTPSLKWLFGDKTTKESKIQESQFLYCYKKVLVSYGLQGFYYETGKSYVTDTSYPIPKGIDCPIIPSGRCIILEKGYTRCDKETYIKYGGK